MGTLWIIISRDLDKTRANFVLATIIGFESYLFVLFYPFHGIKLSPAKGCVFLIICF